VYRWLNSCVVMVDIKAVSYKDQTLRLFVRNLHAKIHLRRRDIIPMLSLHLVSDQCPYEA
jgi:hypothetical protein